MQIENSLGRHIAEHVKRARFTALIEESDTFSLIDSGVDLGLVPNTRRGRRRLTKAIGAITAFTFPQTGEAIERYAEDLSPGIIAQATNLSEGLIASTIAHMVNKKALSKREVWQLNRRRYISGPDYRGYVIGP